MRGWISVHGRGWDGRLFGAGRTDVVMIVMSGSDGGLWLATKAARFLADNGIPALALGYFRTRHSKMCLDRIPLEIIGEAIGILTRFGYRHVGIEGASKGAELALVAATHYPQLFTVIARTPCWYVGEGLGLTQQPTGHSSWTWTGREIPCTPYAVRRFNVPRLVADAGEFNILPITTGRKIKSNSIIPVERLTMPSSLHARRYGVGLLRQLPTNHRTSR